MITTTSFTTKHKLQLIVDVSFLAFCAHPEGKDEFELSETFNVEKFLHNVYGKAIVALEGQKLYGPVYWIDGKYFNTVEEWEKAAHDYKFNHKIDDIIK